MSLKAQSMTVCPKFIASPALKEEFGQKTGLSLIICPNSNVKMIFWLMKRSLLRIWSNAKANKATPVIPRVCDEKVGSCTFSHSQLLSLCFFICHRFLSLSHSHSHSHPCSTFSSKMDLNSNLTLPEIFKQYRFWFEPDSASPQTQSNLHFDTIWNSNPTLPEIFKQCRFWL